MTIFITGENIVFMLQTKITVLFHSHCLVCQQLYSYSLLPSYYAMLHYVMLCCVSYIHYQFSTMLCYAILVAFLIFTVTFLLRYVMLYYAILCYVTYMHCYLQTMLCYAMLCYAMLCYIMLCYAMLCYIMLCFSFSLLPFYYAML